jgi:hypothetical protein
MTRFAVIASMIIFSILRHGDVKRYLSMRILRAAERIVTRDSYVEGTDASQNEYQYPDWNKELALTCSGLFGKGLRCPTAPEKGR